MAGPVADVLLRATLTGGEATAFDAWRGEAFESFGDDLWGLREPAMIGAPPDALVSGSFGIDREPWTDDPDSPELPRVIGYRPAEVISIYAMANGDGDHLVLGRLCLTLARRFDALIDFCGALIAGPLPSGVPYLEPDAGQSEVLLASIDTAIGALPGTLHGLRYQTARETPWVQHIGDAEFLAAWLEHPRFRMIK
ncbi:hypothetical protein BJF79_01850 [Actinomadura sp. CNU-125]|uniref:DUF6368 family protein n=1 Tax=Actinomadura sp. CNU-125 TaxID=1904961 RepID=UPI00096855E7|nr:DUF6368 family protein [Actinomadura sp. CNU-125]OLT23187.1 hypothetical protein BJF79_01850 [Actinomadura sp. CNU-125]